MEAPERPTKAHAMELRIRFFNYNMGNNGRFASPQDLPGPLSAPGSAFEQQLREPFADGRPVDMVFIALAETRVAFTDWCKSYRRPQQGGHLDVLLPINAARESGRRADWALRSIVEEIGKAYNGNLKTLLAYSSHTFVQEQENWHIFGRLPEAKVFGTAIPNPKKSFAGATVHARHSGTGLRLTFVGAHFPVEKIGLMFDSMPGAEVLRCAKVAMAKVLRKILRRAGRQGLLDPESLLVLQGDLNSRTLLLEDPDGGPPRVADLLQELLRDEQMQAAIQHGLSLPPGRWREIVECEAAALPVTYKYTEEVGYGFWPAEVAAEGAAAAGGSASEPSPRGRRASQAASAAHKMAAAVDRRGSCLGETLTLGGVVSAAGVSEAADAPPAVGATSTQRKTAVAAQATSADHDLYKRTLQAIPPELLMEWGLCFKKDAFRPFRFPASADRVVYWAPIGLDARVCWKLPRQGYEVHHKQDGSDHRPVGLEALLQLLPASALDPGDAAAASAEGASGSARAAAALPEAPKELVLEVCEEDGDNSDVESPHASRRGSQEGRLV